MLLSSWKQPIVRRQKVVLFRLNFKRETPMAEAVRVGIVGTSHWADFMFLPSIKSHA